MAEIKAKKVIFKNRDGEYLLPMTEDKTGLVLFDTILKDHVLTFEESKGLALQGTYVYKNAVAGERYGYPDFYAKCLEEYQNSSNTKQWLNSNVTKVGSIVDDNGVLSGYSSANYVTLPNYFAPSSNPWEFATKVTTGDLSTITLVVGGTTAFKNGITIHVSTTGKLALCCSSNGTSWDVVNAVTGSATLSAKTTYWIKAEFTGSEYNVYYSLDGSVWNLDITVASSTAIYQGSYYWVLGAGVIGATTWYANTTSLDLNESYININGERWWAGTETATKNPNGHLFYDISIKEVLDDMFESTGMAWMYGIDQENERIFLPRNVWFEQMSMDEVGKAVEAGLPSIEHKHTFRLPEDNGSGGSLDKGMYNGPGNVWQSWTTNANSAVNAIYGKSDTVQPNAIKKLLYICVGNVISQSSITDVVDITTTENDIIPLGYSTYQKNAQPSLSWLKSEGQWNDGNVYETFYNWSVNKLGEAFASGYIVEYTSEYTDYDLVINQDDITFRLPLLDGSEDLPSDKLISLDFGAVAIGNYTYTAPCNGIFITRFTGNDTSTVVLVVNGTGVDKTKTTASQQGAVQFPVKRGDNITFSVQTASLKSIEGQGIVKAQGNGSLYFKVGNAVQNLQIIDTANLIENYATKSMLDGQWVDKYMNLSTALKAGTYTLDLSTYLPSDGHVYEILCHLDYDQNTDGTNVYASLYSDIISTPYLFVGSDNTFGGVNVTASAIIPARNNLVLYITGGNMTQGGGVTVHGYRRVGTNQ